MSKLWPHDEFIKYSSPEAEALQILINIPEMLGKTSKPQNDCAKVCKLQKIDTQIIQVLIQFEK